MLLLLAARGAQAESTWGKDINPGTGPALLESVRAYLLASMKAPQEEHAALISAFAAQKAAPAIEAVKRARTRPPVDDPGPLAPALATVRAPAPAAFRTHPARRWRSRASSRASTSILDNYLRDNYLRPGVSRRGLRGAMLA